MVRKDYNVLVMDFGYLASKTFQFCFQEGFTMKTVLMLNDQMISRIEYVHKEFYTQTLNQITS